MNMEKRHYQEGPVIRAQLVGQLNVLCKWFSQSEASEEQSKPTHCLSEVFVGQWHLYTSTILSTVKSSTSAYRFRPPGRTACVQDQRDIVWLRLLNCLISLV